MPAAEFVDHYEVLEVSPNASGTTIERVFRYLAKKHHPDVAKAEDGDLFTQVVEAYEVLRNPQSRAAYDVHYERQKSVNTQLVAGANAAGDDCIERYKLLSILYGQRRREMKKPGIGIGTLETLVPFPPEVLNFHIWYFREKGWITREESGQFSISALGVDHIESMNLPAVSRKLRLEHQPSRIQSQETQPT